MAIDSADPIPPELLRHLEIQGNVQVYERGELVVAEGEAAASIFVLISGRLKVFTRGLKERELVYNEIGPGEVFGEMLLDGGSRSASVAAIEPSRCVVIEFGVIRPFMAANPIFAEHLILSLIRRLRHSTQQVRSLGLNGVYERVVDLVCSEAILIDGQRALPQWLTQQEVADRVGATREMVSHVFRDLQRGGFLSKGPQRRWLLTKTPPKRW